MQAKFDMAHLEDKTSEHSYYAIRACANCKRNKKKCDRKMPDCGNCLRKRATCDYGLAALYNPVADNGTRQERCRVVEGSLASSTAIPSMQWTGETSALTDPVSKITSEILGTTDSQKPDPVDRRVQAQVLRIIDTTGLYIDDITSRYFNGVHKWLPVISRPQFNRRITADQGNPSATSAMLLLSMALVSQTPCSSSTKGANLEQLYLSTKMMFAQVQASAPTSLSLIQAELLIATYERAHNLFEAAYISIGTCARMAFAMNLHKRRTSNQDSDREALSQSEEEKNLWWGIVICDRIIGCEPPFLGKPLAVDHPHSDDELPLEASDLDRVTTQSLPNPRLLVSAERVSGIGPFGREAQATYLLSRVLDLAEPKNMAFMMPKEAFGLDTELQNFLSSLVSKCAGTLKIYCGPIATCIAALFTLHETVIAWSSKLNPLSKCCICSYSALTTTARIVIDMSYSFNRDMSRIDINTLSPACSPIIRTLQQHLKTVDTLRDDTWHQDYESLQKSLELFDIRWPIPR